VAHMGRKRGLWFEEHLLSVLNAVTPGGYDTARLSLPWVLQWLRCRAEVANMLVNEGANPQIVMVTFIPGGYITS
jgi:hypothetical protein